MKMEGSMHKLKRSAIQEAEKRDDELWKHTFTSIPRLPLVERQKLLQDFERKLTEMKTTAAIEQFANTLKEAAIPRLIETRTIDLDEEAGPNLTRRPGLYLTDSKVTISSGPRKGQRIGQYGLFTKNKIKAGDFVMFYTGAFFEKYTWKCKLDSDVKKALTEYRIKNREGLSIAAPMKSFDQGQNLTEYPAAATNEPGKGSKANLYTAEGQFSTDDGVTHSYFPMFACVDIEAHSELLWNYGNKFDGGYEKGEDCSDQQINNDNVKQELWAGLIVKLMHMKGNLSEEQKDNSNHIELIDKLIRDKNTPLLAENQAKNIKRGLGEDTWATLMVELIRKRENPFLLYNVREAKKRAIQIKLDSDKDVKIRFPYNVIHSTWKSKTNDQNISTEHKSHAILDQELTFRTPNSSCNVTTNNPAEESEESEESEEE